MNKMEVYIDNNATTMVAPEVVEAMLPFFSTCYGNPSSLHAHGKKAATALSKAREQLADFLVCHPQELCFTSCATESNHMAIYGILRAMPEKKHIITTEVEHSSIKTIIKDLEHKNYQITELEVDKDGSLESLETFISEKTALVSIMYANNETGVIFDIEKIGNVVKKHNIIFHVDGVQAIGKIPINLADSNIDLLSISGHKFHALKGIGALFIRQEVPIRPLILGHQENKRRGGTEALASVVGMGVAAQLAKKHMEKNLEVETLRDKLEKNILQKIPGTICNGLCAQRLANTSNISFAGLEGEILLRFLSKEGIYASHGAACSSGSIEPSHVLMAMSKNISQAKGAIRFSLSRYNTDEEIEYVLEKLLPLVKKLEVLKTI